MTAAAAPDRQVIACNYAQPTSACPAGARCYITQLWRCGREVRLQILARSRSGRWIQKWESIKKLTDFRLKTLPPEHPLFTDPRVSSTDAEDHLKTLQDLKQ